MEIGMILVAVCILLQFFCVNFHFFFFFKLSHWIPSHRKLRKKNISHNDLRIGCGGDFFILILAITCDVVVDAAATATVLPSSSSTIFFYEINMKRNRITIEKAIQQKSLVFFATTTPKQTHTNKHKHTQNWFYKHIQWDTVTVSIIKFDAMFGAQYSFERSPLQIAQAYAYNQWNFNSIDFYSKISSFNLYAFLRTIR